MCDDAIARVFECLELAAEGTVAAPARPFSVPPSPFPLLYPLPPLLPPPPPPPPPPPAPPCHGRSVHDSTRLLKLAHPNFERLAELEQASRQVPRGHAVYAPTSGAALPNLPPADHRARGVRRGQSRSTRRDSAATAERRPVRQHPRERRRHPLAQLQPLLLPPPQPLPPPPPPLPLPLPSPPDLDVIAPTPL